MKKIGKMVKHIEDEMHSAKCYAELFIEKVRKVYKPSAEMQEKWDGTHRKYVEEMAEIERMLSL